MDIPAILLRLRPGAQWSLNGDRFDDLEWKDSSQAPTEQELSDAWLSVQVELAKQPLQELRQKAYSVESDPLFFGWQRGENTKQEWVDKVAEIRARYPYAQ